MAQINAGYCLGPPPILFVTPAVSSVVVAVAVAVVAVVACSSEPRLPASCEDKPGPCGESLPLRVRR